MEAPVTCSAVLLANPCHLGLRPLGLGGLMARAFGGWQDRWSAGEGSGGLAQAVVCGIVFLAFENEELFWKLSNFLRG